MLENLQFAMHRATSVAGDELAMNQWVSAARCRLNDENWRRKVQNVRGDSTAQPQAVHDAAVYAEATMRRVNWSITTSTQPGRRGCRR